MSEPTRQPALTLRTSMSSLASSRSKDAATAAVATRRAGTQAEGSDGAIERTLSSDHLLQGRSHIFIAHNGERYQLRETRLGKLILTK
ncbi:hemin uptake protein HemP [Trinickia dinghuensis]|uniref:Hemin uptake protein HemP n=1 Tax=Trinickia dinghuensis TaxID=2291023 RepID=A0A3D8JZK2_9BURK|nr:hemin uptake protein HemP [Trinickia dinghuensis]RDU98045.1 hemin uptake protein HemP [Trinickia dinghuensis]